MRTRAVKAAAALVAGAVSLGAAEAAFRHHEGTVVFPWDEPGRGFATEPHTHGSNAAGFHEREIPAAPDPTVRRIAVLGDSMTWGTTTAEEAWPRVAEARLGGDRQVLNFSHYGYDASQAAATLRSRVWAYAPQMVVFAAYVNDLVPSRLITVGEPPFHVWVGVDGGVLPVPLRRASAILRAAEGAVMARRATEVEEPAAFSAGVADMAAQAREHGVPLLVFGLVPHVLAGGMQGCSERAGAPGRCEEALARTRTEAALVEAQGLPFASVLPYVRASGHESFFPANPNDWEHPGPEGHRVVGEAFVDVLGRWERGEALLGVDGTVEAP